MKNLGFPPIPRCTAMFWCPSCGTIKSITGNGREETETPTVVSEISRVAAIAHPAQAIDALEQLAKEVTLSDER